MSIIEGSHYLHFLWIKDLEGILEQINLAFVVSGRICSHRWRCIDLDKPRSQLVIEQDVETVQLKAVLIVDNGLRHGLQRANDAVLDQSSRFRHALRAILAHQVEFEAAQVPFASESIIVLRRRLLNSYVGQVHVGILDLLDLVRVTMMRESAEAGAIQVHSQRLVARHEHVDSQIELLASDQKRIHDVLLDDVGLSLRTVRLPSEVVLPLRDLCELVQ